jgi:hypothetical protein
MEVHGQIPQPQTQARQISVDGRTAAAFLALWGYPREPEATTHSLCTTSSNPAMQRIQDSKEQTEMMETCDQAHVFNLGGETTMGATAQNMDNLDLVSRVIIFMKMYCFREDLFTEATTGSLVLILNLVGEEMKRRVKFNDITIDTLYKVTAKEMGKSVGKLPVTDEVRLIFEAGFVLLFCELVYRRDKYNVDMDMFLRCYPEFAQDYRVDEQERHLLLKFRNMMVLCQKVISPQNHKNHLVDLVTRLAEGKNVKYIVGSGQSDKTSRRVLIYRREGNVPLISKGTMEQFIVAPLGSDSAVDGSNDGTDSDMDKPICFAAGEKRAPHQSAASSIHKLEKKRNKHLTYLESMTHKRQDRLTDLRGLTSAKTAGASFRITKANGECLIVDNVMTIEQVLFQSQTPSSSAPAVLFSAQMEEAHEELPPAPMLPSGGDAVSNLASSIKYAALISGNAVDIDQSADLKFLNSSNDVDDMVEKQLSG